MTDTPDPLIAEYRRIRACSPAAPWCDDPSYGNSDHYDGHQQACDEILERIFAQTRLRLDALTGERAADEERLRQAGARVGIWYGCDTPDWLAEEILGLRARLDALEAEHQRLMVQRVEQSWRWGRILGPKYDGASFEEVAQALAAAEAQLTLAESSRASEQLKVKVLTQAVQRLTEHMDRAGGDRDGMPECPWCRVQDDDEHQADCELLLARQVLADASSPSAQETPKS